MATGGNKDIKLWDFVEKKLVYNFKRAHDGWLLDIIILIR